MNDMASRTRPSRRNPDEVSLRALRNATFDYMLVLRAGEAALTDEAIAGRPDLTYLRNQIRAALRQDRVHSFSNPAAIMGTLARLLGEAEEA